MPFRIRYAGNMPGQDLSAVIERLADGFIWDAGTPAPAFVQAPTKPALKLLPNPTFPGRYDATLPAAGWPDGDYLVSIVETAAPTFVVQMLRNTLRGGDDASPDWGAAAGKAFAALLAKAAGLPAP